MALYRPGGVDPLVRGAARLGLLGHLGLWGVVGFAPSWTDELVVLELQFQLGLSWRLPLSGSLYLEPGLLAGVLQHTYFVDLTDDSGVRADFSGQLFVELGWRLHRYLGLSLWVAPGLCSRSRDHRLDGAQIWRRSQFSLEAGLRGTFFLR